MKAVKTIAVIVMLTMLLALTSSLSGCASGPRMSADPMPEGLSYSGLWYSDEFQHMYLVQDGDKVTGVYSYGSGGMLEGELDGNLLLFDWHEPGNREELRQPRDGKGYFHLINERAMPEVIGEWGYSEDRSGGGPWTAEFVREFKDTDPTTVEEVLEIH